jgi:peptidoglycan/LPS O-acetylase OafA/YrhL
VTLREALLTRDRGNSLNLIRLLLAGAVIVGHSWPLGGFGQHPAIGGLAVGEWAVGGFFCVSGFLIASSRVRLSFGRFMLHRALRILPGFWVCLVAVAFVAAPVSAMLVGERYSPASALNYVTHNAGLYVFQHGIEATLSGVPYPESWNGSLWTLVYEFLAYIGCGVALTGWLSRRPALVSTGLLLAATLVAPWADENVSTQLLLRGLDLGVFFLAGMVLFGLSDRLPVSWAIAVGAAGLLIGATVVGWHWAAPLPLAYLLLFVGHAIPRSWSPSTDISYGTYIYGFPVQQLLALAGAQAWGWWAYFLLSVVFTVPLAWISWTLVEGPAQALKGGPGRRPLPAPPVSRDRV